MKRSDAVIAIVHVLKETTSWPSDFSVAEKILSILEEHGIQPPCKERWGGHGTFSKDGTCDDYVESCHFKWEEE